MNKDKYANKKRKELEKDIQKIKDEHKYVEQDLVTIEKWNKQLTELRDLKKQYTNLNNYINNDVENVLYLLREEGFLVTLTSSCNSLISSTDTALSTISPYTNLFLALS